MPTQNNIEIDELKRNIEKLKKRYKGKFEEPKAKNRNLKFELSKDQFKKLTKLPCYYCGKEPKQEILKADKGNPGNGKYIYNGIDRIDNKKGYTIDNCVSCCKNCNNGKKDMGKEEFFSWISDVYRHSICLEKEEN